MVQLSQSLAGRRRKEEEGGGDGSLSLLFSSDFFPFLLFFAPGPPEKRDTEEETVTPADQPFPFLCVLCAYPSDLQFNLNPPPPPPASAALPLVLWMLPPCQSPPPPPPGCISITHPLSSCISIAISAHAMPILPACIPPSDSPLLRASAGIHPCMFATHHLNLWGPTTAVSLGPHLRVGTGSPTRGLKCRYIMY